jgi:hypothetical protein
MRDIGPPVEYKEVAELMAADGKQRPSKLGMQTFLPTLPGGDKVHKYYMYSTVRNVSLN